jgi:hypothetical protein
MGTTSYNKMLFTVPLFILFMNFIAHICTNSNFAMNILTTEYTCMMSQT